MIIETHAYARAGLLGNPSDGYFGKTISIIVKNFGARVTLYETPELRIELCEEDRNEFCNIHQLVEDVRQVGYYGGQRLIKAAIKVFYEYCEEHGYRLHNRNFTIRYRSSIPRQVGMAGSSAIVTATMRALQRFYEIDIPKELLPSLVLKAEREELGISAGLQDRVIQVYEGCVYMDFRRDWIEKKGHGKYEPLDPQLLPNLYIAYRTDLSKVSGSVLSDVRSRWERGDPEVRSIMEQIADLAAQGKEALLKRDTARLYELMNRNFDLRRKIMYIKPEDLAMVETARRCGASAKFCGSGGSIIGIYEDDEMLTRLIVELKKHRARVIRPFVL